MIANLRSIPVNGTIDGRPLLEDTWDVADQSDFQLSLGANNLGNNFKLQCLRTKIEAGDADFVAGRYTEYDSVDTLIDKIINKGRNHS